MKIIKFQAGNVDFQLDTIIFSFKETDSLVLEMDDGLYLLDPNHLLDFKLVLDRTSLEVLNGQTKLFLKKRIGHTGIVTTTIQVLSTATHFQEYVQEWTHRLEKEIIKKSKKYWGEKDVSKTYHSSATQSTRTPHKKEAFELTKELELQNLLAEIDTAIDKGDKELFTKLTTQLNELKEEQYYG